MHACRVLINSPRHRRGTKTGETFDVRRQVFQKKRLHIKCGVCQAPTGGGCTPPRGNEGGPQTSPSPLFRPSPYRLSGGDDFSGPETEKSRHASPTNAYASRPTTCKHRQYPPFERIRGKTTFSRGEGGFYSQGVPHKFTTQARTIPLTHSIFAPPTNQLTVSCPYWITHTNKQVLVRVEHGPLESTRGIKYCYLCRQSSGFFNTKGNTGQLGAANSLISPPLLQGVPTKKIPEKKQYLSVPIMQ